MLILTKKRKLQPLKFLAYLLLSFALVFYQQFYKDHSSKILFPYYSGVSVITNVTRKPAYFIYESARHLFDYVNAVEENRRLRHENALLKAFEKRAMFLATENKELRYLANMSKFIENDSLVANVYSDSSNLYMNSLIINVGLDDDILPGFAVMNQEGLVGRVLEADQKYARVLMINDYNAAIPVRILETGVQGILKGQNNSDHVRLITQEKESDVKTGQHVVTSSLQGLFNDGLPVGLIGEVSEDEIEVFPYANLNRINKVLIIKR